MVQMEGTKHKGRMTGHLSHLPCSAIDTRSNAEFLSELATVRDMPLAAQVRFMRNKQNRDRAMCVPTNTLSRLLTP